jgi:plastocyanin
MLGSSLANAQQVTLTGRVVWEKANKQEAGNVVVWLTPEEENKERAVAPPAQKPRLVQRNKSFDPHVLVVPVGSVVAFPNRDPFFHNVFSLFDGKRFDLGLYEAGSTRDVHFDKAGISYIFCNIHPEMSAVVIALDTPFYGVSDKRGQIVIPNVPGGRYSVRVWYENALPETLKAMTREITVSQKHSTLGLLRLKDEGAPQGHKNLYGQDYNPPTPDNPAYSHP